MTWNVNGKEFDNALHLAPEERYQYFIKKVADWREVWSYGVMVGPSWGPRIARSWYRCGRPIFAEAFAVGEWLGYKPQRIELEDWLTKWIPGMEKDRRLVAVFPALESQTTTASPLKLKSDLEAELKKYE